MVLAAQRASCARAEIFPKDSWTFSNRDCMRFCRSNVATITKSKGVKANALSLQDNLAISGNMTINAIRLLIEYMKAEVVAMTAELMSLVHRAINSPVRFWWKTSNDSFCRCA